MARVFLLQKFYFHNFIKDKRLFKVVRAFHKKSLQKPTIMGIETSCDDTGCAIIDSLGNILGEALHSQNTFHVKHGGVNPVFAAELHRENIQSVVNNALQNATLNIKDIDVIAVTVKPGLVLCLKVGVKYAKYLARKYKKQLIPIHHMEAHALIARMYYNIPFPFLVLLISGGHCILAVVRDVNDFLLLGESLDNSPGEVLDKVARRLKLKNISIYSQMAGGKAIECAAKKATNPNQFNFPIPLLRNRDCNFSFSGLKEHLERKLLHKETENNVVGDEMIDEVYDLCAAFQHAVGQHIAHRTERALVFCNERKYINEFSKNIVVSGGVACNNFIFQCIENIGHKLGFKVYRPPAKVCTDNGLMIAWNGLEKLRMQCEVMSDIDLKDINPDAPLGRSIVNEVQNAKLSVRIPRLNIIQESFDCR